jgi:hypothetical protein
MSNLSQSGSSSCSYSVQGGNMMADISKQIKLLVKSSKSPKRKKRKKVVGTKKKIVGTKKKVVGVKKKKPVKKKTTSVKKKTTSVKKKKPVKKKTTSVKKKKPVKKKTTSVKKKKPVKKKTTGVKKKKPVKKKTTSVKKKKPVKKKKTTSVKKKKPVKKKKTTSVKKKKKVKKKYKGGATSLNSSFYGGEADLGASASEFGKLKSLMGGAGSDFVGTLQSRGPVNNPSGAGTGMSGEQLFRTFNKTGSYMSNENMNCGSVLQDGILDMKLAGC